MTTAQIIIQSLQESGVTHIFGIAGEETLALLDAIRDSSITYVPVRHEQSAGFMAATIGRLTGKAGVCMTTLGPGATNAATAVAYAYLGAMPLLIITGQKSITNNPQGNFQLVDVTSTMRPNTKMTTILRNGNDAAVSIRELLNIAEEERPGSVHIEVPKDIAQQVGSEPHDQPLAIQPTTRRPIAEEKAIRRAVDMIQHAKTPLLLIGAGANRKRTANMLQQFVNTTGIYFFTTQMGKGVLDERQERFLGTAATTLHEPVHRLIAKSDLIVNVGHDIVEKSPFLMQRSSAQQVIHINYQRAQLSNHYFPQLEVIGDIANTLWQIKEAVTPLYFDTKPYQEIRTYLEQEIWAATDESKWDTTNKKIHPAHLVGAIRKAVESDGIVVLDNGMYKLWFSRYYRAYEQNTLLLDNALATMGAGLPSGIAAKLQFPQKQVVVVSGDGGFLMSGQELETAVRLQIDLIIIIVNDNQLGMIAWEQEGHDFASFGLQHGNPDFVQYATSFGAKATKVHTAHELHKEITARQKSGGVHVIECPIDYADNADEFPLM